VKAFLAVKKLEGQRSRPVVVLRDYWQFKYVENPGAAWGILGRVPENVRVPFFHLVSVAAITFILVFYRRLAEKQRLLQVALSLVLGGAVGNFLDRIIRGYVIDFIDWHWKNDPGLHWPTFNIADIGISVGVALMLGETLLARKPEPAAAAAG
jgi:signal peptidase II